MKAATARKHEHLSHLSAINEATAQRPDQNSPDEAHPCACKNAALPAGSPAALLGGRRRSPAGILDFGHSELFMCTSTTSSYSSMCGSRPMQCTSTVPAVQEGVEILRGTIWRDVWHVAARRLRGTSWHVVQHTSWHVVPRRGTSRHGVARRVANQNHGTTCVIAKNH